MSSPKHIVIDARIRRSTTGRYADRLVEHLQDIDRHHRYTILVQPDDKWSMHNPNFTTLPCPYPQFSLNPLHQLGFAWQLYCLKPDLIHFTMTQQPLLYFGTIVTTTHDTTMYSYVRRGTTPLPLYKAKMGLYRFLVWWSHRKSKHIIVPTWTVEKEFANLQPFTKKKMVVTYEASEPAMAVKPEKPPGISGDFLLYVGTAFPHKNLQKMIETLEILNKTQPGMKLVITGKREEKHFVELMAWAKNRPGYQNLLTPGYVSDAELRWLYEHCQAYVFTSLSEGFGLPPLEAMAHGAPVVSSNASVMPEVYDNAAHYFDARDPEDAAAKISEVLNDRKLRTELIRNGYKRLKKFSWRKMAQETLAVYKKDLKE
ncbi:MAG TPA: glycosyltransferase family 1 protein [Candidatus Saccharimonadales bacterium]|nr:glycosyltransferase family 1 protein [Candidatus Saccharimonadales bacterium]